MKFLEPVRDYKARHASTLLTFDAVIRLPRPDRGPQAPRKTPPDGSDRPGRNWRRPWRKTPGRLAGNRAWCGLYQLTLSGFIGNSCRHLPTCSEYAYEAIARHGLWKGGWLALFRVGRCGPGGTHGIDNVPETLGCPPRLVGAVEVCRFWSPVTPTKNRPARPFAAQFAEASMMRKSEMCGGTTIHASLVWPIRALPILDAPRLLSNRVNA
jgi:putative membrane protein insertion efficiency factor